MTHTEFNEFQRQLIAQVVAMKDTKGKEYANSEERFANFRRLSEQLGIKDYQIGWIYCVKHLDAIAQYMRTGKTLSEETIRGRFVDAITYLTLIAGMVQEAGQVANNTTSAGRFPNQSNQPLNYLQQDPNRRD